MSYNYSRGSVFNPLRSLHANFLSPFKRDNYINTFVCRVFLFLTCTPQSLRDSQFLPCFRGGAIGGGVFTGEQSRCRRRRGFSLLFYLHSVFFWADTSVPPLRRLFSVFLGTHKGCPYGVVLFRADTPVPPLRRLFSVFLGTHKGCPYGVVLFWAPTRDAPTVLLSVLLL